jgi:phage terminase small subunit
MNDIELTAKQELFCYYYVLYLNATKAAIEAGYSRHTAYSIGNQNLKKVEVQKRIERMKSNLAETAQISALRIAKEHEKIAFANAGELRSGWITMKEFESLTEEQKACIQEIATKQTKRVGDSGDCIVDEFVKIKLYDKQKSLDSLNNMFGYNAPVKSEVKQETVAKLDLEDLNEEELAAIEKVGIKALNRKDE